MIPLIIRCPTNIISRLVSDLPELSGLDPLLIGPDLSWHKGLKNTGKDAEVYAPQSSPNGLIQCTVSRKESTDPAESS